MNDFLKILSREVDNPDRLYLYPEDGNWYAYEQSACRLKQLVDGSIVRQVINLTYEVVLVRAQISDHCLENELGDFMTLSPGMLICDKFIEIPLNRQSQVIFERWKQMELEKAVSWVKFE